MKISSNRLLIQEAQLSEAPFYYELLNSPTWLQFIGDRNILTLNDAESYIKGLQLHYKTHGFGLKTVRIQKSNTPVGICGLLQRSYLNQPDLGFAILPEFQGKGIITEAAKAILNQYEGKQVFGITSKENKTSQHLLNKLGFKTINHSIKDIADELLFELIRP